MAHGQIPTYHLAPNFSILPPPGGPLELGSIVASLRSVEVLNEACRQPIPQARIYCHHKHGFSARRSQLRSGTYGVWAQMVGSSGLGGELSWSHARTEEDTYRFEREDTIYFTPTREYMRASMKQRDVAEWVEGADFAPVYIITGLKIARCPSVSLKRSKQRDFVGQLGAQQPGGLPLEFGPKVKVSTTEPEVEEAWEGSDDFVVGLRVNKLVYKRAWLSRNKRGELETLEYVKGATLVDASDLAKVDDEDDDDILLIAFDEELEEAKQIPEIDDDVETLWIVPNSHAV